MKEPSAVRIIFEIPLAEFGGEEIQKKLRDECSSAELITNACGLFRDSVISQDGEITELQKFGTFAEITTKAL